VCSGLDCIMSTWNYKPIIYIIVLLGMQVRIEQNLPPSYDRKWASAEMIAEHETISMKDLHSFSYMRIVMQAKRKFKRANQKWCHMFRHICLRLHANKEPHQNDLWTQRGMTHQKNQTEWSVKETKFNKVPEIESDTT